MAPRAEMANANTQQEKINVFTNLRAAADSDQGTTA